MLCAAAPPPLSTRRTRSVALYNRLCFLNKQWRLLVPRGAAASPESEVRSNAFQRFKITSEAVDNPNATFASRCAASGAECGGVTFVAGLRHAGIGPPGLTRCCKRTL